MVETGHEFTPGEAGKSAWDYIRQAWPGMGAMRPGTVQGEGGKCMPENPIAAAVAAVIWDPCVRMHLELVLEEAFRNFRGHSQLPPWEAPPFAALHVGSIIDGSDTVSIPFGGAWTEILTGTVRAGERATLKMIGQDVAVHAAWSDLTWRLVKRGKGEAAGANSQIPIEPYNAIANQWGQIEAPTPIWVDLHGPCIWGLQASNAHVGTNYDAVGRVIGWVYPASVDDDHEGGTIT